MKQSAESGSRASFSGRIGYVLAVAGSAIGLGNIWRFPYLVAKYGGGIFLLIYLVLTLTFGYTMIVSETALGRMTKRGPSGAFQAFDHSPLGKLGGWINAVIPMLIVPYYSVIGGWVLKYLVACFADGIDTLAQDDYFSAFLADSPQVVLYFVLFSVLVFAVILAGVRRGIEQISKVVMPVMLVLAVIVAVYSCTRPGALAGIAYFLVPNFRNFSLMTFAAAMGQMFYSLSIAMGILYTYGSYLKSDVDIEKSTGELEFFDTGVAVLAGLMIIPSVFSFFGGDIGKLHAGPSLTFITLPAVFASMPGGTFAAATFFLLFLLAALTSAISLLETSVNTFEDGLHISRGKASLIMAVIMAAVGLSSSLGFGVWSSVKLLGMDILDFFDFLTNSVMMPIAALATCLLILRKVGFAAIEAEVGQSSPFRRRPLYRFCLKYLAPVCLVIILASSIASALGLITM